ncbi:DUF4142 domain-containing protein [Mucilaginibacter terrenus]|uniref:DUF4142 domain-containing protein n=1 Tax=Mucilaginibacter terrenus TaxID=2482727 RepID=A0A3E2NL08_9SPHI|nr:DUF4142 domain-containing protein [Mucilaginibacter terrenus]RFZ81672.1 DUF4142 domain-containing protein [Mucilaginibacter terrenus]
MKKFTLGLMMLLGSIVSLQSCKDEENDGMRISSQEFTTQAASGNMLEIQAGQLALTKASNAEVKQYGQHMVTDHTKATDELKATAAKNNITVPTQLTAAHQQQLNALAPLSGAEFDKAFAALMVQSHQEQVTLFEKATTYADIGDFRTLAAEKLPTLKEHLTEATTLNATVNK